MYIQQVERTQAHAVPSSSSGARAVFFRIRVPDVLLTNYADESVDRAISQLIDEGAQSAFSTPLTGHLRIFICELYKGCQIKNNMIEVTVSSNSSSCSTKLLVTRECRARSFDGPLQALEEPISLKSFIRERYLLWAFHDIHDLVLCVRIEKDDSPAK